MEGVGLYANTLLINSLSLVVFGFEGATIGLDMSGFLLIVVSSIIPRLALASLICQWSGKTSPSTVRSVGRFQLWRNAASFQREPSQNTGPNIVEIGICGGSHGRMHPNPRAMCTIP